MCGGVAPFVGIVCMPFTHVMRLRDIGVHDNPVLFLVGPTMLFRGYGGSVLWQKKLFLCCVIT